MKGKPVVSAARTLPKSPYAPTSPPDGDVHVLNVAGNVRMQKKQLRSEVQYHLHADLQVAGDSHTWDTAINVGTSDSDDLLNYRLVPRESTGKAARNQAYHLVTVSGDACVVVEA